MNEDQYKELTAKIDRMAKESRSQTAQSYIQTGAVILVFIFGIVTLTDLKTFVKRVVK